MSEQAGARTDESFAFSEENEKRFQETLGKYPTKMAVLLPALWLAQEQNGYISDDVMAYIARRLELSPVHVLSVVEFYTMFHRSPVGRYVGGVVLNHLGWTRPRSSPESNCEGWPTSMAFARARRPRTDSSASNSSSVWARAARRR